MSEIAELKEEIAELRTGLVLANDRIQQLTNALELKADKITSGTINADKVRVKTLRDIAFTK
ncbi:hypothetical protein QS460_00695 [Liquorilactobacillus mali]|uniref:hypothetical protein n=1 Tax=Liquorilactobacillus mali TaxID=1618 RepID=UPI0026541928|nr:hypothetical protein [Liquorilactobacillus mali]MDN7144435.1 hypothetical protein [Liquorilactobacillus mali]